MRASSGSGAADADAALAALAAAWPRWIRHLSEFVGIPSVSSDPRRRGDVRRGARWLCARLREIGPQRAGVLETPGHPIVWARWRAAPTSPTLLVYGHYDVVSPGPPDEWRSPPFAPVRHGRFLYGRGASDDKGPLMCQLAALDAWQSSRGHVPVNVLCLFDGEEEVGSTHLRRMLRDGPPSHIESALICDTRMLGPGRPALVVGLRGSLAAELEVAGPRRDLHSGAFGGAVRNPAHVLCDLIASLHDAAGRVAIPGFYRDVRPIRRGLRDGDAERAISIGLLAELGRGAAWGEPGLSAYERTAIRPALDVNGLTGGHTGAGGKGIVPARVAAKLSFRLVPDQEPRRVAELLRRHVVRHAPPGVGVSLTFSKPSSPVRVDPLRPALRAASVALEAGFGCPPALVLSGGTIPLVELLSARGVDPVLMGFARPDDGMHGANERVDLDALAAGARSIVHLLALMEDGVARDQAARRWAVPA